MTRWAWWLLGIGVVFGEPRMLLSHDMPGKTYQGPLPSLSASQQGLARQLERDVRKLSDSIGERNSTCYPKLCQARDWIETQSQLAGFAVKRQSYSWKGQTYSNLEWETRGQSDQVIVVGAHYDSAVGCPAANDNGSGVAALLALTRFARARRVKPRYGLRWVAFVNEEPPHFVGASMGSLVYAKHCVAKQLRIRSMLSLETLGYYSDEPGSQKYPAPLSLSYPSVGNFIGFVGNSESGPLVQRCVGSFRKYASFPSQGAALPGGMPGVGWSDHWSFWQTGVPALMVTDTAPFRYTHYHQSTDTADRLDYSRFARVVEGLDRVVWDLANDKS